MFEFLLTAALGATQIPVSRSGFRPERVESESLTSTMAILPSTGIRSAIRRVSNVTAGQKMTSLDIAFGESDETPSRVFASSSVNAATHRDELAFSDLVLSESSTERDSRQRMHLLARRFANSKALSDEDEARLAIVNERVRVAFPQVTSEDRERLAATNAEADSSMADVADILRELGV